MGWTYLCIAGLFEVFWVVGLKYTAGFSRLWPSVVTITTMGVSIYFLSLAVKTLPVGTAYAVWTGIGAVGTVTLGMIFFGESRDALRFVCIALILAGIVGLRLVSQEPGATDSPAPAGRHDPGA